jgi:hypothetical protein
VNVSEGNTVPSTDILGSKTYLDIGSGTVFKLSWPTPNATNNLVDSYTLSITTCDTPNGTIKTLLNQNIGKVNEYFVTSSILASIDKALLNLSIKLIANSAYGSVYSGASSPKDVCVAKGCGTYVPVTEGYPQKIFKRAIAFSKLNYVTLKDTDGKELRDVDGKLLYAKVARGQDTSAGWTLMQEFVSKANNTWKASDIRYEVLMNSNGEIITDSNNEPIYVL